MTNGEKEGEKGKAAGQERRRGLKPLIALLVLILLPAGVYAFYVLGQLDHIREHNLRRLEDTAESMTDLLNNARITVASLSKDPGYGCAFFQRQIRLKLKNPDCDKLANLKFDSKPPGLRIEDSTLQIVASATGRPEGGAKTPPPSPEKLEVTIEVQLGVLVDQIPFGDAFDQLLIVDQTGTLLGPPISPRLSSPMEPPGVDVPVAPPRIRILKLANLRLVGGAKDATVDFKTLENTTFVRRVELAGTRYDLTCQPLRMANLRDTEGAPTWRLCGLVDSQRSFQQALEVAPHVVILLLVLVTFSLISWPILKLLTLAPRERVRFADMYLTLIATLALVMLLAVAAADVGTYWDLRERSSARLRALAQDVSQRVRAEIGQMYLQLREYDQKLVNAGLTENLLAAARSAPDSAITIGCLHLPPERRLAGPVRCQGDEARARENRTLEPPGIYPAIESIFWMRPCDGMQFVKASTLVRNTPAVGLSGRQYFQAVKHGRLWSIDEPNPARSDAIELFVETAASITTGTFFAAVSARSALSDSLQPWLARDGATANPFHRPTLDCEPPEDQRVGIALTTQPESVRHPVLAPGVGFAVVDQNGHVVFHSDQRRAASEKLLADTGLAKRLRAALESGTEAEFYAQYQTRPHQIFLSPMPDLPFAVMTFADDEVMRTLHVELIARAAILLTLYLLLALLGTLLYMLFHGREPPVWLWPRMEPRYRDIYGWTVWSLAAQLIVFLLGLGVLRGWTLILGCVLLPVPSLATVVLAARIAEKLSEFPEPATTGERDRDAADSRRNRRICQSMVGVLALIVLTLAALMWVGDQVNAAQSQIGGGSMLLLVLLTGLLLAPFITASRRESAADPADAEPASDRRDPGWRRRWREALMPHIVGTVCVWLLLGALPAYGLYKFALEDETTVWTKLEQAYLARVLAWRGSQIQEDFRLIQTADGHLLTERLRLTSTDSDGRTALSPDIYPSALMSDNVAFDPPDLEPFAHAAPEMLQREFWTFLANVAPIYNETTTHLRYLLPVVGPHRDSTGSMDRPWSWQRAKSGHAMLQYQQRTLLPGDAHVPRISAQPPVTEPHLGWLGWISAVAYLALLVAWVSYSARRLFFGEIEIDAQPADGRTRKGGQLRLDRHLGRLSCAPDQSWAKAELAPLAAEAPQIDASTLQGWCEGCTTRRAVLDRILDRLRNHYEKLWGDSAEDERLVLIQLVQEGFASPRQTEVVRNLLKRGLLRRDPVLRPMNHSFALFVTGKVRPDEVHEQEKMQRGRGSRHVRGLLIGALLLLLVFLSFTQQDVVQVWTLYLGTAAAGATGVLNLLSMLNRPGGQKAT